MFEPLEATIAIMGGHDVVDSYGSAHPVGPIHAAIARYRDAVWAAWYDLARAAKESDELVAYLALGAAIDFEPYNPFLVVASPVWAKPY